MSKKTNSSPSLILHIAEKEIRWAITDKKGDLWQHPFCKSRGIHFYIVNQRLLEKEVSPKDRSLFLLEKLFEEEIKKVDPEFFEKPIPKKWIPKYPTPYHLIAEMLSEKKRPDIRLYYLFLWFLIKEAKASFFFSDDQSLLLKEEDISFSVLYKRLQEFLNKNNLLLPVTKRLSSMFLYVFLLRENFFGRDFYLQKHKKGHYFMTKGEFLIEVFFFFLREYSEKVSIRLI